MVRGQLERSYAGGMATDVGAARVKVTGDVRSFARDTERDLNKALERVDVDKVDVKIDTEKAVSDLDKSLSDMGPTGKKAGESFGEGFNVGADGKLQDARGRFVKTGSQIGEEAGSSAGKQFSESLKRNTDTKKTESKLKSAFTGVGKALVKSLAGSMSAGLSTLSSLAMPALVTAGLGIAAGIAAVAGPAIGGLLASSVLAAGGLGFIGLGAFLLREEPALVAAATRMSDSMKSVFTKAAQPMLKPMVEALDIFEKTAKRLGPTFKTAFASLAPAIAPLAAGLSGLVESTMPGFLDLIKAANPFLQGMAAVLPNLGRDISSFFGNIAASGPEATIFFQDFIGFIGGTLRNLGEFVGWLTKAYVSVKEFLGPLPGILREAWSAMKEGASASEVFGILKTAFDPGFFQSVVDAIRGLVTNGLNFLANNIGNILQTVMAMRAAVFDAIIKLVMGIAEALPAIIPQLITAVVGLVTTMVSTLVTLIPKLVEAAGLLVNGLVDGIVTALPTIIQGAVQIVTSLLTGIVTLLPVIIQAGLRLIQGLVEGIITAIPQIQLALIQILPELMSAVLTMLPSIMTLGIDILKAIVQGIGDTLPTLVETVKTQVIPALIDTLKNEGPKLLEQGAEVVKQILQGMTDSASIILDVITTQIIPAITSMLEENPEFLETGVSILTTLLQGMIENIESITTFITETLIPQFVAMIEANLPTIIDAGITILKALLDGIIKVTPELTVMVITKVIPAITVALYKALPEITSIGYQLMIALGKALIEKGVERGKNAMESVKSAISGFFSSAGDWLADAGRKIIDGLVNGLQAGFGRVRSKLNELTDMLPDWKGPAEVDRKILRESGQLVMEGFGLGIDDQRAAIKKIMRSITDDLPGFAAGRTRGGDGASAFTVNFEPGSIVINGQGAQAGNDAADAILERLGQARGLM